MTYRNFEHYLSFIHAERNPELLDDDLPDAFGEWMDTLSVDEWIEFADKYAPQAVAERDRQWKRGLQKKLGKRMTDFILSSLTPPTTEEKENL